MSANSSSKVRTLGKVLFILYIGFILYFLLITDWYGRTGDSNGYQYNLELFREIRRFWNYRRIVGYNVMFANIFGNVIIFIPFGFFLPMASKHRSFLITIFYSFSLSFIVEIFQLITMVGSFDVDDLLLNTLGGICGYVLFILLYRKIDLKEKN